MNLPPKTLLIVGSIPGAANVGQILLQDMLQHLDDQAFQVAALLNQPEQNQHRANPPSSSLPHTIQIFTRPPDHATRRLPGRWGGLISAAERLLTYDPTIQALAQALAAYIQTQGIRRIWAILNMPAVIDVVFRLQKSLNLPLLTQVWDDVEHLSQERRLDATIRRRTRQRFGFLLQKSTQTAVIGESMAREYTQRYGATCTIIRHGLADRITPQDHPSQEHEFSLGFSGGLYAPCAWKALLEALALLGWELAGKPVKLVVLTGSLYLPNRSPAHIEYLGWRPPAEVQHRLSNCDLLYVPYPFALHQKPLAQLSFPTKLSTYVTLGRPIFVHAPVYSSLVEFYHQYPLGICCTSLDPENIAQQLLNFVETPGLYSAAAKTVAQVGETILSQRTFINQIKAFVADPTPAYNPDLPPFKTVHTQ